MTEITDAVLNLLTVFIVAAGVRIVATRIAQISYTVALVAVGLAISTLNAPIGIQLSHDLILLVILPAIVFRAAAEIDFTEFKKNIPWVIMLVVIGLPSAVLLLGWLGSLAFGFPLLIALLYAAIIFPVDPASVVAIYRDMDAPKRLSVLAESESLLDDGFAIVIFFTLFSFFQTVSQSGTSLEGLITPSRLVDIAFDIVIVSVGGAVVGLTAGYVIYRLLRLVDEEMVTFLLTAILAYGSFMLADHFLHVNGIIATVTAGLVIGTYGKGAAIGTDIEGFVNEVWDTTVFLVNTVVYILIGVKVPIENFLTYADLVIMAAVLVLFVRAVEVYTIMAVANVLTSARVPMNYQHILVWGGIHTVVPIALVLTLPEGMVYRERLWTMVFGVAVISIIVQGLLMPYILRAVGLAETGGEPTEAEEEAV